MATSVPGSGVWQEVLARERSELFRALPTDKEKAKFYLPTVATTRRLIRDQTNSQPVLTERQSAGYDGCPDSWAFGVTFDSGQRSGRGLPID